ncbi:glucuronate isomerase [Clostridium folliculivorans]|uniref:Uronate isomerase n=1 Tax=Clostridium folliculivorans TaxID=2886038 RepID=A0A9W5Y4V0_9CLOT|nr:glucuronate isomerase [Clostridium folliculivorans]GKU26605.1 uronate isomerase [Clostridium folliculivorans]GKU28963.1 uronate isomerase [Clostridium folliculivorans]
MLDNDFMLKGKTAKLLYNDIAKNAPIYDYHCHLSAKEIYEDKVFSNISKIFLEFDHYKWRAMRYAGVPEAYITGDANDFDKFKMWARTCERLIGSPLYHWTNMELKNFFGVNEILKESNAEKIYEYCNKKISEETLSPVKFITSSKVKLICTTDDPTDNLEYHKLLREKELDFKVLPTFRPDKALNITKDDYFDYLKALSKSSSIEIYNYQSLIAALKKRIEYFDKAGCKLSDHSLESLYYFDTDETEVAAIFKKRLFENNLSFEETEKFRCFTLKILAEEYNKHSWTMQLHLGAMRNNNEIMFKKLGPDAGFDIMNDFNIAPHISRLIASMDKDSALPKTIIYTLNPKDNLVLSALPHCFGQDGIKGKVQFGAAWWFNDHKEGINEHLKALASQGTLAYFVGMLTDSRSFLSYARHDYFRRILCTFIGTLVDDEEFENDTELLKEIIEGICFKNIKNYLKLED